MAFLDGLLLAVLGWDVTRAAAWGVGCAAARGVAEAVARVRLRWAVAGAEPDGAAPAGEVDTAGAAVLSPAAVWAGAVRANSVAMPTAVTALSWVARQVRRERRRKPSVRAAPGCCSP